MMKMRNPAGIEQHMAAMAHRLLLDPDDAQRHNVDSPGSDIREQRRECIQRILDFAKLNRGGDNE